MIWDEQQSNAKKAFEKWYMSKPRKQVFTLYGYAGVGKTTLAKHFAESIGGGVCYASYTGKAASIMRKNGCVGASTIHSLIYIPNEDEHGIIHYTLNSDSPIKKAKLVIIDECSMVGEQLGSDLRSFNTPILVLGDPGQLPPIEGEGYFSTNKPDIMLTEIHRQAKENPIIELACIIREGGIPNYGKYGDSTITSSLNTSMLLKHEQVLVGRNKTRTEYNAKIRKLKGYDTALPIVGEKLICLKNDHDMGLFNGGLHLVLDVPNFKKNDQFLRLTLDDLDEENKRPILAKVHKSMFNDELPIPHWKSLKGSQSFAYGYTLSVHKAQGSQYSSVLVYDESWCFRENSAKWLYTAVTRAQNFITLVRK